MLHARADIGLDKMILAPAENFPYHINYCRNFHYLCETYFRITQKGLGCRQLLLIQVRMIAAENRKTKTLRNYLGELVQNDFPIRLASAFNFIRTK